MTQSATRGQVLFARFSYAPNQLGFCGPAETEAHFDLGVTGETNADVAAIASKFSGAWPYARLLADAAGVDDPLDESIMRAYWIGSDLLTQIDRTAFAERLVKTLGGQAGHYWDHLNEDLLDEVMPTHAFHVFGVYPWSRLLHTEQWEHPLYVLDRCRISWGEIVAVHGEQVRVRTQHLAWEQPRLSLAAPVEENAEMRRDGRGFIEAPVPGDLVALHWGWVADRLSGDQVSALDRWTQWQLDCTNERLSRHSGRP